MIMRISSSTICLLIMFFLFDCGYAQTITKDKKPKIGLVLSGGGAKGLAHIGVLKVMEEAGIVPDIITGTSMGSIVGGLYAIGYTPKELEKIALTADWDKLLSDASSLNNITIEEKPYYGRYFLELAITRKGIKLPSGLIEGQHLYELFSKLTRSVYSVNDFNEFPVPFTCVAVDLETANPVRLHSGSLHEAMRASMAIPSIFSPVEIHDTLLVDGGVVRNFPVQEAVDMGADIIIGVYLGAIHKTKDNMDDMVKILSEIGMLYSMYDSNKQMELVDIPVLPDLGDFTAADFDDAKEIIARGEKAANEVFEKLKKLSDSLSIYKRGKPKKLPSYDAFFIDKIEISGNNHIEKEYIQGKLRIEEGKMASMDEIEKRIAVLYGTRYFTKVSYEIIKDGEKNILHIKVKESNNSFLKLAVHYDSENRSGLMINYTGRNILGKNSRFITQLDFAELPKYHFNYFKYLGIKQNSALNLSYSINKDRIPLYEGNNRQAEFNNWYSTTNLKLQTTRATNFSIGANLRYVSIWMTPRVVGAYPFNRVSKLSSTSWVTEVFLVKNNLNRPFFPDKG